MYRMSRITDGPLSNDQIRRVAPSAFAVEPHERTSERYTYIPTAAIIEGMRKEGFVPTFATQSRTRDVGRKEHTKHLLRFRLQSDIGCAPELGKLFPEVVLINSHDGSSAYQVTAGLFRLICLNGLITGQASDAVKVRHKGDVIRDVIEGSFRVIESSRAALDVSRRMGEIALNRDEQLAFADAAHILRFDGTSMGDAIQSSSFLRPRRHEDNRSDLFTTFNVIQEAALRGGLRGVTTTTNAAGRPTGVRAVTTKAVTGIDQATALNRALFALAESMAKLKGQA